MRYTILFAVAFALATNTARAMNSFYYECGDDTEVALAIAKDTGKVLGTNVWIKIRLRVASTNKSLAQSNKENCSGSDGYHRNSTRLRSCTETNLTTHAHRAVRVNANHADDRRRRC